LDFAADGQERKKKIILAICNALIKFGLQTPFSSACPHEYQQLPEL